ncbi:MAG: heparinase II/III family protein, partial [Pseudomonadota bacterium]
MTGFSLNVSQYVNTLRYLRPVQIYGRLWHNIYRPKPDLKPPPELRTPSGIWCTPAAKYPSFTPPTRFRLLNEDHEIVSAADWNRPAWNKLWLYNLHYFDDLSAGGADERLDAHYALIRCWIAENPPGIGNGWEPYPLSLRIVNWIKWLLAGNKPDCEALASLAVQARFLNKRLEYHLLGNHLFSNAKTLVFAGLFFAGPEADAWLAKGWKVLADEIPEQV